MEYVDSESSEGKESDDEAALSAVHNLYDDDCSDSEREWREAVRAAVETEIQYQVHLRLALDQSTTGSVRSDSEQEQAKQLLIRCDRPKRTKARRKKKGVTAAAANLQQDATASEMGGTRVEEDPSRQQRKSFDARDIPTIDTAPGRSRKMRPIGRDAEKSAATRTECPQLLGQSEEAASQLRAKSEQPRAQSLLDYLHSKYGVPLSHLEHWTKHGRFICNLPKQLSRGVDMNIKWPVEREIVHLTPQLAAVETSPQRVPFNIQLPPSPSPTPNKTDASPGLVVYSTDKGDVVSLDENGAPRLRFESRFECGNLRKAVQT